MPQNSKFNTAKKFGEYLDQDNFIQFKSLLAPICHYKIGDEILTTNDSIAGLYEKNMKEGKAKFDKLVWGKSRVEAVNKNEFDVYFSDFLTHRGVTHNYKCKQRITINEHNLVLKIEHIELEGERESYSAFLKKVGLLS